MNEDEELFEDDESDSSKKWVWTDWHDNTPRDLWDLVEHYRTRVGLHRAEKRLTLQIKALCRYRCKGDKKAAAPVFTQMEKDFNNGVLNDLEAHALFTGLEAVREGRKASERSLINEAKKLPIATWPASVPGLNLLSLAQLVAEIAPLAHKVRDGEMARGRQEACVWKRLGVGLIQLEGEDPQRQRKAINKGLAELMGYNPSRRSVLYVIGDNLIKTGGNKKAAKPSVYYQLYLTRKAYEQEKHPDLKPKHIHVRAKRYVEKKLVRHLLAEWNKAVCKENAAAA